jgi:hypothetical protein
MSPGVVVTRIGVVVSRIGVAVTGSGRPSADQSGDDHDEHQRHEGPGDDESSIARMHSGRLTLLP